MKAGDFISGKYRLSRLLGTGGMGSVWAARNEMTDRDFAIKFLHTKLADNKEAIDRFYLEARACGQIKHPAVVNVYDVGQAEDGSLYLVMELLEGEGFDQRLGRAGVFRPADAAAWIAFIARGLEEAHVRGLVHRDLKPANVFFALDDRGDVIPKILDFGVSKAVSGANADFARTSTGAVLGSPTYMSPEQAQGDTDVDGRSDVWSLGVILYESLTGKPPFDAANYNALMLSIISKPHRPVCEVAPGVPVELSQLVDQTLAKQRQSRVSTARELADRLEAIAAKLTDSPLQLYGTRVLTLAGGGATTIPRSTTQNAWGDGQLSSQQRRRSSTALLAAGLLLATVLLGGVVAFIRLRPPLVAVAGRSAVALAESVARLHVDIDRLDRARADAAAVQRARDAQPIATAIDPSELPPAKPLVTAPSVSATSASKTPGRVPPASPVPPVPRGPRGSGPVTSPGF